MARSRLSLRAACSPVPRSSTRIGYRVLQEIGDHGVTLGDMLPDKNRGWQKHVVRIGY